MRASVRAIRANFLPLAIGFFAGMATILIVYHLRGILWKWRLTPEQGRIWEVILKAIAGLLAFSGAIVAVLKYLDDKATNERKYLDDMREIKRKQEEEKATMLRAEAKEAIKDLKAMRQEIYLRLIKSMAKIMNYDPGDDEWKELKAAFFEIYWGELRWVWNKGVEDASENYSAALYIFEGGSKEELVALTEAVVCECRNSLGEAWAPDNDVSATGSLKPRSAH